MDAKRCFSWVQWRCKQEHGGVAPRFIEHKNSTLISVLHQNLQAIKAPLWKGCHTEICKPQKLHFEKGLILIIGEQTLHTNHHWTYFPSHYWSHVSSNPRLFFEKNADFIAQVLLMQHRRPNLLMWIKSRLTMNWFMKLQDWLWRLDMIASFQLLTYSIHWT